MKVYFLSFLVLATTASLLISAKKPMSAAPVDAVASAPVPPISWISVEEAAAQAQQNQKPILIDLYTTWCGWCKQMDKKTYSNKKVAQYLSDKFNTVRLDAETHTTINWQGKVYDFDPQQKCNTFAVYLAHGQLEFPTTIIIAPGYDPQAIPGYMEPKDFEMLVKFFGENAYKTQTFETYQKTFHHTW